MNGVLEWKPARTRGRGERGFWIIEYSCLVFLLLLLSVLFPYYNFFFLLLFLLLCGTSVYKWCRWPAGNVDKRRHRTVKHSHQVQLNSFPSLASSSSAATSSSSSSSWLWWRYSKKFLNWSMNGPPRKRIFILFHFISLFSFLCSQVFFPFFFFFFFFFTFFFIYFFFIVARISVRRPSPLFGFSFLRGNAANNKLLCVINNSAAGAVRVPFRRLMILFRHPSFPATISFISPRFRESDPGCRQSDSRNPLNSPRFGWWIQYKLFQCWYWLEITSLPLPLPLPTRFSKRGAHCWVWIASFDKLIRCVTIIHQIVKRAAAATSPPQPPQQQQQQQHSNDAKELNKNIFGGIKSTFLITFRKFDTFSKGKRDISSSVLSVIFFHSFFPSFIYSFFFLFQIFSSSSSSSSSSLFVLGGSFGFLLAQEKGKTNPNEIR